MSSAGRDFWTFVKATQKYSGDQEELYESDDEDVGQQIPEILPPVNYVYTSLASKSHIRLLSLQAGCRQDTIICHLEEINLYDSAERYDALSYVWGAPGGELMAIQVNNGKLNIGARLHCALKYLRYPDQHRVLWVDAICINQTDIEERSIQVPMMLEIYQNAAFTICFLGPTLKKTQALYSMLEELAGEGIAMGAHDPTYSAMGDTLPTIINNLPVHPVKTKLFDKYVGDSLIIGIVKCEWWYRVWTVQELILSSNAVMMTGRYTITWEKFCVAVDHGFNIQIWGPVFLGFSINPVVVPYLSMRALIGHYRAKRQVRSPALDLFHLLVNCRHRDSTDPRDKIYAVIGLLRAMHPETLRPSTSDALEVETDYSHSTDDVYLRMTMELLLKMQSLDVLGICPRTTRPLPSWATDWSVTDRIGSPLRQDSLDRPRTTHASNHTKATARFSSDGTSMFISGYELTSVVALDEPLSVPVLKSTLDVDVPIDDIIKTIPGFRGLNPNSDRGYSILKAIQRAIMQKTFFCRVIIALLRLQFEWWAHDVRELLSVFKTLFSWQRFAAAQQPTNPGGDSGTTYWHTLCGGTYKSGSVEETEGLFNQWSNLLQPLRDFTAKHPRLIEKYPLIGIAIYMRAGWQSYGEFWSYIACSQHRRLGRAANGWLCLLPKEAIIGDVIILAKGGQVPLIIRKGEGRKNRFVGEAYVHGIMNGEAFEEVKCVDIEIQ